MHLTKQVVEGNQTFGGLLGRANMPLYYIISTHCAE